MLIFFSGGGWVRGQRMGLALGDVTAAVRNNLAGADFWRKPLLNLLRLLLHLPVNEQRCWRYPCVPCRQAEQAAPSPDALTTEGEQQPPWQMFWPSWGWIRGRGLQIGSIASDNWHSTCGSAQSVNREGSQTLSIAQCQNDEAFRPDLHHMNKIRVFKVHYGSFFPLFNRKSNTHPHASLFSLSTFELWLQIILRLALVHSRVKWNRPRSGSSFDAGCSHDTLRAVTGPPAFSTIYKGSDPHRRFFLSTRDSCQLTEPGWAG